MSDILFRYERVDSTSWAYLASLLTLAIFFKFNRFWSVRNLDLVGLILLAPALLLIQYGLYEGAASENGAIIEHLGYLGLFAVSGLFLLRLLLDASMVRRPLLEPNLSVGGLSFLGASLSLFLMANVITGLPEKGDLDDSQRAARLRDFVASSAELDTLKTQGPGFPLVYLLPHISTQSLLGEEAQREAAMPAESMSKTRLVHVVTARVMAILSQLAIVIGMALIGWRHFDSLKTGIAAATLYLLLPYTSMWTGNVMHALPGALLVWAIFWVRRPLLAGMMLGLACGTIYYPVFLLPLWIRFYWQKGCIRFLIGMLAMLLLLVTTLVFISTDAAMFFTRLRQMFGIHFPVGENLQGVWQFWKEVYRYPIMAAFMGLSISFLLWPAQKNLAVLISCSATIMLGTQFWHAHSGGLALAWYLPLLLLAIFRPSLEDHTAPAMVR